MSELESHHQTITNLHISIERHFRRLHREYAPDIQFGDFLQQNLIFITMDFAPRSGGDVYVTHKRLYEFGGYYYKLCKFILGSSLDRKLKYQPVTYAFLDFEGSRSSGDVDPSSSQFPHVHALMLCHPTLAEEFQFHAMSQAFWVGTTDDVLVERFTPMEGEADIETKNGPQLPSLQNLIDYSMKGFKKANPSAADTDFYRLEFPRRGCKTTWVRRDSPGSPVCGLQAFRL